MKLFLLLILFLVGCGPALNMPISDASPTPDVVADSIPGPMVAAKPAPRCGKERWDVKTMTDGASYQINQSEIVKDTVEHLTSLPAPKKPTRRVRPTETTYFEIEALLVGYKLEGDMDYHLGIASPKNPKVTMIAEVPSPKCAASASDGAIYQQIRDVIDAKWGKATPKFKRLKTPARMTIRGVGFFDKLHGQTLVAPNGIEIHPVRFLVIQ